MTKTLSLDYCGLPTRGGEEASLWNGSQAAVPDVKQGSTDLKKCTVGEDHTKGGGRTEIPGGLEKLQGEGTKGIKFTRGEQIGLWTSTWGGQSFRKKGYAGNRRGRW